MILQSSSIMPDLSNLLSSSSLAVSRCPNLLSVTDICDSSGSLYPVPVQSGAIELDRGNVWSCSWDRRLRYPNVHKGEICAGENGMGINVLRRDSKRVVRGDLEKSSKGEKSGKSLEDKEDNDRECVEKKLKCGAPERKCYLPFLVNNDKRLVECRLCHKLIYPEAVLCSVRGCQEAYHFTCAKEILGFSTSGSFKCPQHACFICKQKGCWRCMRCTIASHTKCAPWPDKVIYLKDQPRGVICWRHPKDWRFEKKHAVPTNDIEEIFCRLPLPYIEEDFQIDSMLKDMMDQKEPTPYIHIRRNIYLVKKKRDVDADVGCTNCSTECYEDCVCRVQCISCSKACRCSETCTNRPFRKDKKLKVVKTQFCGWGVEAAEPINKGDFVIEYIGEVIDDALCEKRLWEMKYRGDQNFYMCEIRKDFTIDATYKGNAARFLNHSCDPNCKLEKWQVDGETRVGVFADRVIKVGEPLTYDYRFVHFGRKVKCCCGAPKCQGYLGAKKKINKRDLCCTKVNKVDLCYTEVNKVDLYCTKVSKVDLCCTKVNKVDFCWGAKRRRTSTACLEIIHA